MKELIALLGQFPEIVPAITKIVTALLRHDDPVAEAERQAAIIAAKEAIRVPFKEQK
ncbi:MAG TPA: hypothetical protein VER11_34420 [Polyangiaceae bacterium]|nr:hypothetical protein [Polyangiaceae bacterium]